VRGLRKIYGATVALDHADLEVRPGQIHGLLGENGAGKSTLVKVLAGLTPADGGEIELFGSDYPLAAGSAPEGCAFIHQDLCLFETLSVAENIALTVGHSRRLGLVDSRADTRRARKLLQGLGVELDVTRPCADLPLADQTAVAVSRALATGARLLFLDEPTAYLEAAQARGLFQILSRLRDQGIACVLITHRAEDVINHCDAITVLRNGRSVATRASAGLTPDELVRLISGQEPVAYEASSRGEAGSTVIELRDASGPGFGPLSLRVGGGEVVGVCGLGDAGHFVLGEALFGIVPLSGGTMSFDDRRIELAGSRDAIRAGIAYVPPDRRTSGLAEALTARENLFMVPDQAWVQPVRSRPERKRARDLMREFQVEPGDPENEISAFSGGNQQKILLAKWLARRPRALVLNEPTAGVDLGAKAQIHHIVDQARAGGEMAVLVISSDFEEVAQICDRVYVMHRGTVVDQIEGPALTADALLTLSYGRRQA